MSSEPTQQSIYNDKQLFFEDGTFVDGIHALTVGELEANAEAALLIAQHMNLAFSQVEKIQNTGDIVETLKRLANSRISLLFINVTKGKLASTLVANLHESFNSVPSDSALATIQLSGFTTDIEEHGTELVEYVTRSIVNEMKGRVETIGVDEEESAVVLAQLDNNPVIYVPIEEGSDLLGKIALNAAIENGWVTDEVILQEYASIIFELDPEDFSTVIVELNQSSITVEPQLRTPVTKIVRTGFSHTFETDDEAQGFIVRLYEEQGKADTGHNVVQQQHEGFIYGTAIHGASAHQYAQKLLEAHKQEWGIKEGAIKGVSEIRLTFRKS